MVPSKEESVSLSVVVPTRNEAESVVALVSSLEPALSERAVERRAGKSKASLREGTRFLARLIHLRKPEASGRLARFALIGLSGLVVNEAVLALLTERAYVYYLAAAVISTQTAILWNFALTERWLYARRNCQSDWKGRLGAFCLVCTTAQLLTIPILYVLVDSVGTPYVLANLFAIGASTLVRFTIAERLIWKRRPSVT
jgi:dolichol-phosphate mannosyltransferase